MVSLKNHKELFVGLGIFTVAQLAVIILRWERPLIWDSSVYVGIGKFLFSLGGAGLWEYFRPPLIPLLIGSIWKSGLYFPNLARILGTFLSILVVAGVYRMVYNQFDKKTAVYTSLLLITSVVFLRWSHYLLTGIAASSLVFGTVYTAYKNKAYLSGFLAGLAFLTRFPAGLVIFSSGLTFILSSKSIDKWVKLEISKEEFRNTFKSLSKMGISFSTPLLAYFALNHVYGKGFLSPVISGASVPALNPQKYMYGFYFLLEAFITNPLLILAPIGVFYALKLRDQRLYGYLIALLAFYSFFTFYPHKEARFMLVFLPLMALFAAYIIRSLELKLSKDLNFYKIVIAVLALIFIFNFAQLYNMNTWESPVRNAYISEATKLDGTVAGLNPAPVAYADFNFIAVKPESYEKTSDKAFREADYFVLNTCSWYCSPSIEKCEQNKDQLFRKLENERKVFEDSDSQCRYTVYGLN